jgi:hypothetical protein
MVDVAAAGEVFAVDGGVQGARYTGRHEAGWADLIDVAPEGCIPAPSGAATGRERGRMGE